MSGVRWRRTALAIVAASLLLGGCHEAEKNTVDRADGDGHRARRAGCPFVRVLGTVQDGGLPHAACSCDRCRSAREDPQRKRWVASLAVVLPTSGQLYLFDATPDLREQLAQLVDVRNSAPGQVDRAPVDGVFLTHAHIGHYLGLAFFGYEAVHTSRLPVMATPRMANFLRANGPWSQLIRLGNLELDELAPGDRRNLGEGVEVTAFAAPHRDEFADTLGYLIAGPERRLFYLPDTDSWEAWPASISTMLADVDVALLDGTFFSLDELPGRRVEDIGHPLIPETMDRLQSLVDAHRLQVYFTHLNHSNPALEPLGPARRAIEDRGFGVLGEGDEFPL